MATAKFIGHVTLSNLFYALSLGFQLHNIDIVEDRIPKWPQIFLDPSVHSESDFLFIMGRTYKYDGISFCD
jgi:hypothetical protein